MLCILWCCFKNDNWLLKCSRIYINFFGGSIYDVCSGSSFILGFLPAHSLIYDTSLLSNTEPLDFLGSTGLDIFITSVAAFQRSARY